MSKYSHLIMYTDGGARGNPGPAAIGVVIQTPGGELVAEWGKVIGHATNNLAEYQALAAGLARAIELGAQTVDCYLDSELIVKQLTGEYKVKEPVLRLQRHNIQSLTSRLAEVTYHHVLRHKNKRADQLVNQALDA